jgi:sRNA-binding protein
MLRLALRVYTTSSAYLIACSKGHKRVDLNGLLEARKNKEKTRAEAQKAEAARDTAAGHAPLRASIYRADDRELRRLQRPEGTAQIKRENSTTIRTRLSPVLGS